MIAKTKEIKDIGGLTDERETVVLPPPPFVYLALENARCPKAECTVKEGDHVYLHQQVGLRHGPSFEEPIHSTVSGTVVGFEKRYHRAGKMVNYIKVENDFKDEKDPSVSPRSMEQIKALSFDEVVEIFKNRCLVGLGGSSFPTYVKLQYAKDKKIDTILINAIECEPSISADYRLLEEKADDVLRGVLCLQNLFHCGDARICIKKKHGELIAKLQEKISKDYAGSGIIVSPMRNYYPQGWEIAMIKEATHGKVIIPPGKKALPPDYGIFNVNAMTCAGVWYALGEDEPVYERYVTVAGDGINKPVNLEVRVGTPITDLIQAAGGYKDESPKVLILGGPMMGAALPSDDAIATKTVTSIIVENAKEKETKPCIHCGSCVYSCPTHLQPVLIMEAVKSMNRDRIKMLNPLNCIECGLCSYSCTSGIAVTDFVRRAKIIAKL